VTSIAIDKYDNVWIGRRSGLIKFDGFNWTFYTIENSGVPFGQVNFIVIDYKNNKWIGTEDGLAVYRDGGVILGVEPFITILINTNTINKITGNFRIRRVV